MKLSITLSLAALVAFTSAAPARDHIRRDLNGLGHQVKAARQLAHAPYPIGTAMPIFATGVGIPLKTATATRTFTIGSGAPSSTFASVYIPRTTGTTLLPTNTTACPVNGALVCNGSRQFGLCNFGSVIWQPVADGTACQDGKIVGIGAYAVSTAATWA